MMAKRVTDTIEELTGRQALAFLPQVHVGPDTTIEINREVSRAGFTAENGPRAMTSRTVLLCADPRR
jgi:hypothetical protein